MLREVHSVLTNKALSEHQTIFEEHTKSFMQDVGIAINEPGHHLLERAAGHLAMADGEPCLGHELADALCHRLDRGHTVVQKKHLPAPIYFSH